MPRSKTAYDRAEFKALLKNLPLSTRIKLTLAVALIFATLGPLITLGEPQLDESYLSQFLVSTLFSALITANIIWNLYHVRRMIVMGAVIVFSFLGWTFIQKPLGQMNTDTDTAPILSATEQMEVQAQRRMLLVLAGTVFVSIGYSLFIMLVSREMQKRSRAEAELSVARDIQTALLPADPGNEDGCASYGVMLPAAEVGGDYFDRFPISSQQTLFIVADIAGHGVGAGILAAMFKSAVWMELRHTIGLAALLQHLNEAFHALTDRKTFVTCAMLLLDRQDGQAILATAGHPPIFQIDGQSQRLQKHHTHDLALGLMPQAQFSVKTVSFQPGDTFVLYTDGAFEAMNPHGDMFGEARLQRLLARLAGQPPRQLCESVLQEIQEFQREQRRMDDITLLAIRCG